MYQVYLRELFFFSFLIRRPLFAGPLEKYFVFANGRGVFLRGEMFRGLTKTEHTVPHIKHSITGRTWWPSGLVG